ncbi:hypothetical protein [Methanobrevibacter curvatus]|nr:hypothetical protein [Methanobrevibacter curvatus]
MVSVIGFLIIVLPGIQAVLTDNGGALTYSSIGAVILVIFKALQVKTVDSNIKSYETDESDEILEVLE